MQFNRLGKPFVLFLIFGCFTAVSFAQKPVWVESYGGQTPYPEALYLTGFGMVTLSAGMPLDEAITQAEGAARQNLIQKIRVQVDAMTTTLVEDINQNYTSQFLSAVKSTASLELIGLQSSNFVDRTDRAVFALAYVPKSTVRDQFLDQLNQKVDEYNRIIETATGHFNSGNNDLAFQHFVQAKTLYTDMMDSWSLLRSIEHTMPNQYRSGWNPDNKRQKQANVDRNIERILNRPIQTLDDAAWWLTQTIGPAAREEIMVSVSAITYRDSGISSSLANYLRQLLERQLASRTQWNIQSAGQNYARNPTYVLTGTFWDRTDDVHVIINLRHIASGTIIASSETAIPKNVVERSGLELLPPNYQQAIADLQALQSGNANSRGLNLSVWTNRGEQNLVFVEGDIMEVSLQVNLPSYVRILYHLKDGNRVLLLDSHHINERDVNRPYTLPYRFRCVAPFGVESMQVIARTEPFERVQTRMVDGAPYLTEDLDRFLANTRGFMMVKEEAQQTESLLTITTMPRN